MKIKLFSDNVPYAIVGFFMTKSKVSWLSWGKESFRKAQKQDKPVYNPLKLVETVDPKQDKARLKSYGIQLIVLQMHMYALEEHVIHLMT